MTTNKRNLILGAAAVLVVLAAVVPELRRQPPTLLKRARKVASVAAWDPKRDNYFWLSDQEALLVREGGGTPDMGVPPAVTAHRVSVATGATLEDAPLEAALHKAGATSVVPEWQLSPDGKWLLAESSPYVTNQQWVATTIDGARQVIRPHQHEEHEDRGTSAIWRPDSRSWIQTVEINNLVHTFSYSLASAVVSERAETFFFFGHSLLGFFGASRVLAIRPQTGDGGGVGVADFGDGPSPAPAHFYMPQVPANMDVQQVVLSPDSSRLAWKFSVKPLPLGLKAAINSGYVRRSSPVTAGLWVSDLNLNHLREIGMVDSRDDHITSLRWTPDGKSLSFVDGDALYTVPAD